MVNRWAAGAIAGVLVFVVGAMLMPVRRFGDRPRFDTWRAALMDEAVARGFERKFVQETLADVEPLPQILDLDRAQSGTPAALDVYLAERVTPDLVARGREMMLRHQSLLEHVEQAFGVQREYVVAIWGAETGYGTYTGHLPVLQALATLAWDPRRSAYFRNELFNALAILRAGHITQDAMTGSWAGAMGQPQFMPTSYLTYAVDFDDDGRRDIWTSVPDTLASIGHYLQQHGWQPDTEWGVEVRVDPEVRSRGEGESRTHGCGALRSLTARAPVVAWSARGVRPQSMLPGTAGPSALLPADAEASLLAIDSRAFLVSRNYETILGYNCSHRYALSVSMLADRLR